jgi:glycosyltransferase involved in cell wall biosynthesis
VLGVSELVVKAIAARRSQAVTKILPAKGAWSMMAHLAALHQLRPDVVHCNLCTPWACATGLTAALTLPHVRAIRVDQLPLRTTGTLTLWRTRAVSLRVDAHVAVGEASARRIEDFYALGRGSVLSIANCVPNLATEPQPPPVRPDGQMVVGSVGRLDAMKAHDVLLRAIASVEGVRVVILGEGAQRQALLQLASDLGVSDRVTLPGWVEDPRAHLSEFDVMALPSRSEGFPLTVVEAMLAARPIVATRVGSVAEAVIDGKTGLLVEKDDVAGLAAALRRLRDDPALRIRCGQRGREVAVARFTVEHMAKSYESLWHQVVSTPHAPRFRVKRPRD